MNESPRAATESVMTVAVNGQAHTLPARSTLADLLARLGRQADTVATAVNGRFVARSQRGQLVLQPGDDVACFQLIVGG